MKLTAHWHNATRAEPIKTQVETALASRITELHGSVEKAHAAKEQWHRVGEPPIHHWPTYLRIAFIEATTILGPSERTAARITLEFKNDH